jgi:hypothetical protein
MRLGLSALALAFVLLAAVDARVAVGACVAVLCTLALEAALALTFASLAVRVSPRGRGHLLLGRARPAGDTPVGPEDERARRVGRAVERVARVLPWRPSCLRQAVATRAMLRLRGIECEGHLGIMSRAPLEAHAWVTVRGRVVQGGPVRDATEVAAFL